MEKYKTKHRQILEKLEKLTKFFSNKDHWWHRLSELEDANTEITRFINNMKFNFGDESQGYTQITSKEHWEMRRDQLLAGILSYSKDREAWESSLADKALR